MKIIPYTTKTIKGGAMIKEIIKMLTKERGFECAPNERKSISRGEYVTTVADKRYTGEILA